MGKPPASPGSRGSVRFSPCIPGIVTAWVNRIRAPELKPSATRFGTSLPVCEPRGRNRKHQGHDKRRGTEARCLCASRTIERVFDLVQQLSEGDDVLLVLWSQLDQPPRCDKEEIRVVARHILERPGGVVVEVRRRVPDAAQRRNLECVLCARAWDR